MNEATVRESLVSDDAADFRALVRATIEQLLPGGQCNKQVVADSLGVSIRALHAKLERAGSSYQRVLDETRLDLATTLIVDEGLRVSEVARRLGFSDARIFSRTFRRWTEKTPTQFRDDYRIG